ncbi:MAG TPA: hypothetical protein VG870_13685 [Chitinophagaceae bacterium]|nr:hypothetical protein [Chitinophagaceae bacterium]
MSAQQISIDWTAFEIRKLNAGEDPHLVNCPEFWEADYLVSHIHAALPGMPRGVIRAAVSLTCVECRGPCVREIFLEKVLTLLGY